MNLEGGFSLMALYDGSTVNGILRVEGMPLVQRYNKGTNKFIPDFTALAEDKKPTAVLILRDVTSGMILKPNQLTWKYNSVPLTFDAEGLCNTKGMEGMFKKIDAHPTSIGSDVVNLPALRVLKNLVPISNYDNDRLSISGTIEINGHGIPFQEIGKDIAIMEITGNTYDVIISDDKGSALTQANESLTATAVLYKDGVEVVDYTDYTFQWVKLLGSGDVKWGTARTQTVSTNDIDNILKLRCDIMFDGGIVASGLTQISDFSDPYYVDFQITGEGVVGNALRPGQSATVKPVARKRSDGTINTAFNSWQFNVKNNAGKDFKLEAASGATFTAASVVVTSADLPHAGGGISGSVSSKI